DVTSVSDGAGGAIAAWRDYRSGTHVDIYAHHVLASGDVDPAWPADGIPLCTTVDDKLVLTIITDGAGGAIVSWYGFLTETSLTRYAQHVLSTGAVDSGWPVAGRAVATTDILHAFAMVPDGAGGAIATWSRGWDIYAQHVLSTGGVDPTWPPEGRGVC